MSSTEAKSHLSTRLSTSDARVSSGTISQKVIRFPLGLIFMQIPPVSSVLVSTPHYSRQTRIPPLGYRQALKLQPQNLDQKVLLPEFSFATSMNVRMLRQLPVHFRF